MGSIDGMVGVRMGVKEKKKKEVVFLVSLDWMVGF